MSVSISIVPFSTSLDLYGEPDRHAAYSLSGYVQISLVPSLYASYFERRRAVSVLLQSLIVTFEGQTELVTEETGYAAFRLCSLEQELVTGEPLELTSDVASDSTIPCTWNVVFNLTVPGWLPQTSSFGQSEAGTRYSLHASAVVQDSDHGASTSWLSAFCSTFRSNTHSVSARPVEMHLNRLFCPPSIPDLDSLWPLANYAVTPEADPKDGAQFPNDVLSKLRVQISVPQFVGTEESSLPFSMRLRTDDLSGTECNRLRVTSFDVNIEQCERYRSLPLAAYTSQYPVPPRALQPPHAPLLDPHPAHAIYDIGFATPEPLVHTVTRTFSLLPEETSGTYMIAGDGYAFRQGTDTSVAEPWFSLHTSIPLAHHRPSSKNRNDEWKRRRLLRPSGQSPFFGVAHRMVVDVTCTYGLTDGEYPERATSRFQICIPMRFVCASPPSQPSSPSSLPTIVHAHSLSSCSSASGESVVDYPKSSLPYANSLPAYSQLFHSNGDRKIDYSIPLPLYTPSPSASDLTLPVL